MIDTPAKSTLRMYLYRHILLMLLVPALPGLLQARQRTFTLTGIKVQQPAREGQRAFVAYAREGTVTTSKALSLFAYDVTLTTLDKRQLASVVVSAATLRGTAEHARLGGPLSFGWSQGQGTAREGVWLKNRLLLWQPNLQSRDWRLDAPFGYLLDLDQPLPYAHLVSGVNAWFAPSLLP